MLNKGGLPMWTRGELKDYAKNFLRGNYLKAFIVCLIFTLLTGNRNNDNGVNIEYNMQPSIEQRFQIDNDNIHDLISNSGIVRNLIKFFGFYPLLFVGTTIFVFVALFWLIISLFIGPLITVGKNRFFLIGFTGDVDVKYLLSAFKREEFWGIFKCMFITKIKIFLWYLLLLIPGIIKSYEYSMIPYLLTKDSNLTSGEAIQISRGLTFGHKLDMFVLDLSFMGWYILGALLFGVGTFLVTPYYEATKARLYNILSGNDIIGI
jgi:uncharacterized membrane protein